MKKVLVYDDILSGHHQEYITHIYNGANETNDKNINFTFVVPESIKETNSRLNHNSNKNITVDYLSKSELKKVSKNGYFRSAFNRSRVITKYIKKHNANEVFLITLCHPLPLLPLFVPAKVKISGIIYRIYFYEWQKSGMICKIKDYIENLVIAKSKSISTPFVLNDNSATCYYNHMYKTTKFKSLPDPIIPLVTEPKNIKDELGISPDEKTFLHFGHMTRRKGTLKILEAIMLCKKNDIAFIFAGVINDDIKLEFYTKTNELISKGYKILVFDEYCSYERLSNLCYTTDCIIIPYSNISFSSGVVGYASLFNKTVIGPKFGLPGKLISRNNLGIAIDTNNIKDIADSISMFTRKDIHTNKKYKEKNSVTNFIKQIFNQYCN